MSVDRETLIADLSLRHARRAGFRSDLVQKGVDATIRHLSLAEATPPEDSQELSTADVDSDIQHLWQREYKDFQDEENQRAKVFGPLSWLAAARLAYQIWQWGRFLYLIIREAYDRLHPEGSTRGRANRRRRSR